MSARKFKFVSPGIFLREIDNSQLPRDPSDVGPVIIGRTRKGPSMVPTKVNSFLEFTEFFGTPSPGAGSNGDIWREGNHSSPTYAAYAAQAWLTNNSPATIVRLAGAVHQNAADAGKAGWKTTKVQTAPVATNGGAYGLFVWPSSSAGSAVGSNTFVTGTLGAVWYLQSGALTLTGTVAGGGGGNILTSSACVLIESTGLQQTGGQWKMEVRNAAGTITDTVTFSFQRGNENFVRKVFNTNPLNTNSTTTTAAGLKTYWLGESYESNVGRLGTTGSQVMVGAIMALKDGTNNGSIVQNGVAPPQSGWFIAQDLNANSSQFQPSSQQKLFKFHGLPAGGEWDQQNIKISIQDIAYSNNEAAVPYGTFTVVVRDAKDTDTNLTVLEQYTGCNLNPNSPDYIAKKIGDKAVVWDDVKRLYRENGNYDNRSGFIRVEVNTDVDNGNTHASLLPFGFFGAPRYKSALIGLNQFTTDPSTLTFVTAGSGSIPFVGDSEQWFLSGGMHVIDAPAKAKVGLKFPSLEDFLRQSASAGGPGDITDSYFGVQTDQSRGASQVFDASYSDLVRQKPTGINSFALSNADNTELSFVFTLDNVSGSGGETDAGIFTALDDASYVSGSRKTGLSITGRLAATTGYKAVLDAGFDRFTAPLFGGSEGVDITQMDPFNNGSIGSTETTSYTFNSVKRAIDSVADPERVEMNLLSMPYIETQALTQHMMNVCEGRGDALAVIDIENGYTPRAESNASAAARKGNVTSAINTFKARKINTSYGCAYYPWVQISDSENNAHVWVPPSVVALGTLASSERASALWFAPAGFNRGGLTDGSAGLNVINVDNQLTSKERDKLYAVNVNPIAKFPAEGIVIFGQKTLQATPSALDRINVRRLLIFVKREISAIAAGTLFEQNVQATWNFFSARANRFLDGVKVGGGLADFKVVLDETTTTPDLVDRNIMYAKVLLKPARAIEFIAVDFVIQRSGASFDD